MEKINKSQIFIFLLILALCITIPLLSTSYRPKYLYFIVNILIIAVGVESGLASFFLKVPENKKPPQIKSPEIFSGNEKPTTGANTTLESSSTEKPVSVILERSSSVKIADEVKLEKVLKKPNPSLGPNQSLFFIGGMEQDDHHDNDDNDDDDDDDDKEEIGELSGQELYHKAETFIGNFYNQLKMQREGSWKKLHEISQGILI